MQDHPILGAVLFAIGAVLIGLVYFGTNAPIPEHFTSFDGFYPHEVISSLVLGYVFVFNGLLFVVLGCRKLEQARARDWAGRSGQARNDTGGDEYNETK